MWWETRWDHKDEMTEARHDSERHTRWLAAPSFTSLIEHCVVQGNRPPRSTLYWTRHHLLFLTSSSTERPFFASSRFASWICRWSSTLASGHSGNVTRPYRILNSEYSPNKTTATTGICKRRKRQGNRHEDDGKGRQRQVSDMQLHRRPPGPRRKTQRISSDSRIIHMAAADGNAASAAAQAAARRQRAATPTPPAPRQWSNICVSRV